MKKRFKKRFIILNVLIIAIIAVTVCMVLFGADHYTLHTRYYTGDEGFDPQTTRVIFSREDVLKAEEIREEGGEVVVDLSSHNGSGEVTMQLLTHYVYDSLTGKASYNSGHMTYSFYVTHTGAIIDRTNTIINFAGVQNVIFEFLFILLLLIVFMTASFVSDVKKGAFSYSLVAYGGLMLYSGLLLLFLIYKMLNNVVNTFSDVAYIIRETGVYYIVAMTPVMMVMAVAVSVSNIWLIRHEGRRPVNALGIAASIVWLIGSVVVLEFNTLFVWMPPLLAGVMRIICTYVLGYFEAMIVSTSVCAFLSTLYRPAYDKDYILILGCAIRDDGSLTPLLKGRADRALRFEKEQFAKTGRHAVFVPSGGQGSDEIISEGEAMERYLLEQGIPAERILREDKSVNTNQNFGFSYKVISEHTDHPEEKKIAFATTNYHIFRGYILSAKNGFRAEGLSAKTKWYFFPNAFLREFIGLLYDRRLQHLVHLVLIILLALFM